MTCGVITGCNEKQEWLLKSWWDHYCKSNSFPVTFIDYGMSKSARLWCEKRAPVIDIAPASVATKEEVSSEKIKIWNEMATQHDFWPSRPYWFAKPQAILNTPYEQTVWIDLDTFIIRSIEPLFDACDETSLALAAEVEHGIISGKKCGFYQSHDAVYNTGIMSYKKDHPFLKKWAEGACTRSAEFMGDQDLFIRMAHEENVAIKELPEIYNWRLTSGWRDDVAIIHFAHTGKQTLYINLKTGVI